MILSPAKINLHLSVFEKNADGYHRVETTMVKVSLFDRIQLSVEEGDGIEVQVDPPFEALSNPDNLAYRAAKMFLDKADLRKKVHIHIQKNIPMGAGLGGGSSNAGTVLSAVSEKLGNPLSQEELFAIGKKLGADVPFFVQGKDFGFFRGRGDELVSAESFPELPLVIVYPNIEVSTAKVYQSLGRSLTWNGSDGIESFGDWTANSWRDLDFLLKIGNDLQDVTEKMHPVIREIRTRLSDLGASFSQMSGSGASVFGLFDDESLANQAKKELKSFGQSFLVQSGSQG